MQGVRQVAMGGSSTALAYDIASIFYNPGALAKTAKGTQVYFSANGIFAKTTFVETPTAGYTSKTDNPMSTPFNLYIAHKLNDKIALGFGVYTPFGSTVNWGNTNANSLRYLIEKIELRNISFTYPHSNEPTLRNVNMEIIRGQIVGIFGMTGSGKSTLIDLILGLLQPSSGSITISNSTPKHAISNWPGSIGYVPQDVFVENSSVKENICLGFNQELVPDDLVWEALNLADLSDFVKGLEGQLDYRISDAGKNLSGGQRQRLGIARALLTQPKIVIFDEATSALDAETENRVSESIMKLTGECTVIFIAHRLSVVRSADMIYYIDKGKIVNQGTFKELRKLNADFNNQANFMGI
jgi:ABC-type bacteriocin/lantibiotic exporter with double-glycine peptidase domain